MTTADQVQSLLDQVAEDTSLVLLPRELVQQLVNKTRQPEAAPSLGPEPLGGYNLRQVAVAMRRTRERIWQLVHQGHFPHAYKLLNGEWRIPASDITDFFKRQQAAVEPAAVDLGRWRKQRVKR
jgi:predicted DNA-binding transcriptional regulator AlpA